MRGEIRECCNLSKLRYSNSLIDDSSLWIFETHFLPARIWMGECGSVCASVHVSVCLSSGLYYKHTLTSVSDDRK
jgi:hypothetical protein